jgi:hypothetical protein
MQFRSGKHVLGFAKDRVYMVGMGFALIEEFVGAAEVRPFEGSPAAHSSLDSPAGGVDGVQVFRGVRYPGLWKGITLRYDPASGGLAESVFVVEPGGDIATIRLRYNAEFRIEKDGGLRFLNPGGRGYFSVSRPVAWQEIEGQRVGVDIAFKDCGDRTIGFSLGDWNPGHPLIVDPTYQWHTFYGSGSNDRGQGIAIMGDGLYVVGWSDAAWDGDNRVAPINAYSGGRDIVVLKLGTDGNYQWHTFWGSGKRDEGMGIAVSGDAIFITGTRNDTWNGDSGTAPKHSYSGDSNIVVLKLDKDGNYQRHTFYGSVDYNLGYGIWASGNAIYVTGESYGTWNGDGNAAPKHPNSGLYDIFVLKLDTNGTYQWHTFYGSSESDSGYGIFLSGSRFFIVGSSQSTWQGDNNTDPLNAHSGVEDITAMELDTDGNYKWHTFYGKGGDAAYGAVAAVDVLYVSGASYLEWNADGNAASRGFQRRLSFKLHGLRSSVCYCNQGHSDIQEHVYRKLFRILSREIGLTGSFPASWAGGT